MAQTLKDKVDKILINDLPHLHESISVIKNDLKWIKWLAIPSSLGTLAATLFNLIK